MLRGNYNFEVNEEGHIVYSPVNIALLRKLWLNRDLLTYDELGPGDPGDFDFGAWHSACHLVAAGAVRRSSEVGLIWLEISYDFKSGLYEPTITYRNNDLIKSISLHSQTAKNYLSDSELLGFIEGTSEGRISARGIKDSEDAFNGTPRQQYDQEPGGPNEGGKVWEHWCTTRDIRESSQIGTSVLDSYIALISAAGDSFFPIVARGRSEYSHPKQLSVMIDSGLTSLKSASTELYPTPIPEDISLILQEATPECGLITAEKLNWHNKLTYYMFPRKIGSWCTLEQFGNI